MSRNYQKQQEHHAFTESLVFADGHRRRTILFGVVEDGNDAARASYYTSLAEMVKNHGAVVRVEPQRNKRSRKADRIRRRIEGYERALERQRKLLRAEEGR